MNITRIQITGLYRKNFDIPIIDNTIILIGTNGTFKSAILKLVSSALSGHEVKNHHFESMTITVDDKDYYFKSVDGVVFGDYVMISDDTEILHITNEYTVNLTKEKRDNYSYGLSDFKFQETIAILNEYFYDSGKFIDEDAIDPDSLSDGEIKLLKLFLDISEIGKKYMIFFDDVETNLSLRWQKRFLTDILASGKCSFLMAVTHSPFIYTDLEEYRAEITRLETLK